jgi:multidrug efflux pump subunit AcrB
MIDTKKGLISWFARNPVAANLLMLIILLSGIASALSIKKQMFPDVQINTISIQVPYLGAAPQEVEEGVIDKVEQAIENIEGLKKVTSVARENLASISIEVENDYDVQEVMDEVKVQVDSISSFPAQTERPVIYRNKMVNEVLKLTLSGKVPEKKLKELAKDIRDEIKAKKLASKVELMGDREYEVSIEVSEFKLQKYGLTFEQVVQAVRGSSLDLPGGSIKSESGDILLRTKSQAYNIEDFNQIPVITNRDGTRILLTHIANVNDGFVEGAHVSMFNGQPAISIKVDAVGDENLLAISERVKAYVDTKAKTLPESVKLDWWGDTAYYLQGRLDLMSENLLLGALLVLIALTLFLELKVAFWVMVGIPICFFGAIALMPLETFNVSINMLSLFAFILVLGIVVDDAIIIGESAYTEIEHRGLTVDSVITGAKRVAMPATFGVLTTIAAFSPMLMVSGVMGAFWGAIAWVVILTLSFSLIESKWILPAHLAKMKVQTRGHKPGPLVRIRQGVNKKLRHFIENRYRPLLEKSVEYRYTTLSIFFAIFILTIGLIGGGYVRWIFFPQVPADFLRANITMNEGTSSYSTTEALNAVQSAVLEVGSEYEKETGTNAVKHVIAFNQSATTGMIFVELRKPEEMELNSYEVIERWRAKLPDIPELKHTDIGGAMGFDGPDVAFQLKSTSLTDLRDAAEELKLHMETFQGVNDIQDSLSGGNEELVLLIKPEAEAFGLTRLSIANQVRQGFYGAEAQRIQRDGEEVKVMIRYPKSERSSIGNLENMRLRTPSGGEVPFNLVADYIKQPSYSTITRIDGVLSVSVTAKADKRQVEPSKVVQQIQMEYIPKLMEKYPSVSTDLFGNSKDEAESMLDLAKAAVFALFCIYALMAIPLKSYSQPIIIMSVIPFGLIGAILGHLVLGMDISILSMFGIIALAGVVVNDSLIMVDFVNRDRAQGHSIKHAAINAGTQRFRAIILTSLTTFLGLVPIIFFEKSLQAQIVIPMATSLAFGIVFATVITLILIPALYVILNDIKGVFGRKGQVDQIAEAASK